MAFMLHGMTLLATGAAVGAYSIYRIRNFWESTEEEMEAMQFGDEPLLQKLMRYKRYVQIAQSAYDIAIVYGPPIFDYLRGAN